MTVGLHRYKPIGCVKKCINTRIASLQNRAIPLPDKEIRSTFPSSKYLVNKLFGHFTAGLYLHLLHDELRCLAFGLL